MIRVAQRTGEKDSYITDYLTVSHRYVQPFSPKPTPRPLARRAPVVASALVLTIPIYDGGLRYGLLLSVESLSAEARATTNVSFSPTRATACRIEGGQAESNLRSSPRSTPRCWPGWVDLANIAYRAWSPTTRKSRSPDSRASRQSETFIGDRRYVARHSRSSLLSSAASGRFPCHVRHHQPPPTLTVLREEARSKRCPSQILISSPSQRHSRAKVRQLSRSCRGRRPPVTVQSSHTPRSSVGRVFARSPSSIRLS